MSSVNGAIAAVLSSLYGACGGEAVPVWARVSPDDMPQPFRSLLVHDAHMTTTLEAHYGEPVALRVLCHREDDDSYRRKILLTLPSDGRIVEFGLVRIHFQYLPADAVAEIRGRERPLGEILIRHEVLREVEPRWYLRFDDGVGEPIGPQRDRPQAYFGRIGTIHCGGNPAIEVLEIVTGV